MMDVENFTPNSRCCQLDHKIEVLGNSELLVETDIIKIGISIESQKPSAEESLSTNLNITSLITEGIQNINVSPANISTISFSISPNYVSGFNSVNNTSTRIFAGYFILNRIEVSVSDIQIASRIIDLAMKAGAKSIDYINFEVSLNLLKQIKNDLVSFASQDAYNRAKISADNLNATITDVLNISFKDYLFPRPMPVYNTSYARGENYGGSSDNIVFNNKSRVSMQIQVIFLIKRK